MTKKQLVELILIEISKEFNEYIFFDKVVSKHKIQKIFIEIARDEKIIEKLCCQLRDFEQKNYEASGWDENNQ